MRLSEAMASIDGAFNRRIDHLLDVLMLSIMEDDMKADEAVQRFNHGLQLHTKARDKVLAAVQQNFKD